MTVNTNLVNAIQSAMTQSVTNDPLMGGEWLTDHKGYDLMIVVRYPFSRSDYYVSTAFRREGNKILMLEVINSVETLLETFESRATSSTLKKLAHKAYQEAMLAATQAASGEDILLQDLLTLQRLRALLFTDSHLQFVTQESANPQASSTGGEYYYYRNFYGRDHGILAVTSNSCVIEQPAPEAKLYNVTWERFLELVDANLVLARDCRQLPLSTHARTLRFETYNTVFHTSVSDL
jgi:hypothetical protein